MKKAIAGALSVVGMSVAMAAAAPAALAAAPAALASAPPPTRVQAQPVGWSGMSVKPARINFGQGGAPFITGLHWQYWKNGSSAYAASGTLHQLANPGCHPLYTCRSSSEAATVNLSAVKTHGKLRYFSSMTVKFRHGGRSYRLVGSFKPYPGAPDPSWIFPLTWPYL